MELISFRQISTLTPCCEFQFYLTCITQQDINGVSGIQNIDLFTKDFLQDCSLINRRKSSSKLQEFRSFKIMNSIHC